VLCNFSNLRTRLGRVDRRHGTSLLLVHLGAKLVDYWQGGVARHNTALLGENSNHPLEGDRAQIVRSISYTGPPLDLALTR
jgi:ATP-dependent helicase YprA (DUF1998 family)